MRSACTFASSVPFIALLLALPLACGGSPQPAVSSPPAAGSPRQGPSSPHARFEVFTDKFIQGMLAQSPSSATQLGSHDFDDRWEDVSGEGDAATLRWIEASRAELATLSSSLDGDDREDATIVTNFFDATRFDLTDTRDRDHSPIYYTTLIGQGLDPLLTRDFAPFELRMVSLRGRLAGIPAIVAAAKRRLVHAPRVSTETAIEQNKGLIGLVDTELVATAQKLPEADRAAFGAARNAASTALHDFQNFLQVDLLPRSDGSFRAGKEAFAKIVRFTLDDPTLDPDALEKDARQAMVDTRAQMLETALELWPTLMTGPTPQSKTEEQKRAAIKAVLDKLAEDHSTDTTIVNDAKKVLADATAFVRANDIVSLPTEPCDVIEMPEYQRGVAMAYCESSGPLEAKPQTFVAIAPPPADWPQARRDSQYREDNSSMLVDLLVHEAMPGHYLQLMHSNHGSDRIRGIFEDGAFVEGWAVYAEGLMAKHGFGGPKVRIQRLKMLLRSATNTVLDHEVHAGQMEEKEALAMMMNEGFQEEGEAVGKWRRARLSKGQLSSYFYGFREMTKMREQAERQQGFTERAYHDKLLAMGSPPMRIARAKMAQ
jgi:uncharacterized protein (DUF885 family)